jgi:hypothetical protein
LKKRNLIWLISSGLLLSTIFLVIKYDDRSTTVQLQTSTMDSTPIRYFSNANWISKAETIDELTSEADMIVRARVSNAPVSRVLRTEVPVWDAEGNMVGSTTSEMVFSDTILDVVRVYMGGAHSTITVMQTGGYDPTISGAVKEIADDPLFQIGEEYILFLVDISGDPIHAPDRELFRIVNPFGRYRINGNNVISYGQNQNIQAAQIVQNVEDIVLLINQAILLKETQVSIPTSTQTLLPTSIFTDTPTIIPTDTPTETPTP